MGDNCKGQFIEKVHVGTTWDWHKCRRFTLWLTKCRSKLVMGCPCREVAASQLGCFVEVDSYTGS